MKSNRLARYSRIFSQPLPGDQCPRDGEAFSSCFNVVPRSLLVLSIEEVSAEFNGGPHQCKLDSNILLLRPLNS